MSTLNTVRFLAPNQCYFTSGNLIVFQSYETIVCTVQVDDPSKIVITPGQPQSKTTAKYLNRFLDLHTSFDNYKDVK